MATTSAAPSAPVDEAIRVVATPSQASYFAGEPFSVTVTFTNTRTPQTLAPRSASQSHRRSAHSISSVPLSRPPTSPATPRTAVPLLPSRSNGEGPSTSRKGLIGNSRLLHEFDEPPLSSVEVARRRMQMPRSISGALPSSLQLELPQPHDPVRPGSPRQNGGPPRSTPPSPSVPSGNARSAPIAPTHPHARKHSVVDGQLQLHDIRSSSSLASPATPNASTSTFSLSLDPIAESGSSPGLPTSPSFPSPNPGGPLPNVRTHVPAVPPNGTPVYAPPNGRHASRRPTQLGLGHGISAPAQSLKPPRSASSALAAPNTELILYSYAQLSGTLTLTPPPDVTPSAEQARTLNNLRRSLLKRKAVGGGSMDITSSLSAQALGPARPKPSHGRSASLSSGLFSLLAPSSITPSPAAASASWTPGHKARNSSVFSLISGPDPAPGRAGASTAQDAEEIDAETPLPTLEVQPSMLAVDLSLAPGESRTYTYSITLPENLPPTFRGRALKFSYQFVLGVCRANPPSGPSPLGVASPPSSSRVMKVPIRVYNHVAVGRPPRPYDLQWSSSPGHKPLAPGNVTEENRKSVRVLRQSVQANVLSPSKIPSTYPGTQDYARNLLASLEGAKEPGARIDLLPSTRFDIDSQLDDEDETGPTDCRHAIEMLTRNPKKASYDVTKDGVKVAVLTFTKSSYRLGETVLGVVETNDRSNRSRVLKLSALLEAHESLPSAIAPSASSKQLRRVHAEHHSSFLPATLRTTFSLDIPPDATPAFQTGVREPAGPSEGGLEWKVRLCLLVALASPHAREGAEGVLLRSLVRDGPRGQWGSTWKAPPTIAPMERPVVRSPSSDDAQPPPTPSATQSWMAYLASSLLGPNNAGYHDGDEEPDEDGEGEGDEEAEEVGGEEAWRDVRVEMVECEVPIRVWPGNTVFKATEVVFDV